MAQSMRMLSCRMCTSATWRQPGLSLARGLEEDKFWEKPFIMLEEASWKEALDFPPPKWPERQALR